MTGRVFDIQRFSVHDGPGIRTTVFMKGCPLSCRWCHNPEGLSSTISLQYFKDKCIGCGRCKERTELSDSEKCPTGALTVCGRDITVNELIKEVLRDRVFYGENGGVTFSGGECLLQADFVASALSAVKALGVHTAIDTSGCVKWSEIKKTLDSCDLYLYDVKCHSPSLHKKFTGANNLLITENLKRLSATGKDIWIRVPVIPGFNNKEDEMSAVAELVSSLSSVKQVTLMPYHTLGASKYETLGLDYGFDTDKRISSEELAAFKAIFEMKNIIIA